jgi:hypothetical protein
MPGRMFNTNAYLYGVNGGSEKDDEIANVEGAYSTAEYWELDTRLGRRWNIDPIVKPWESPYAVFGNNPIYYNDPSGLDKGKSEKAKEAEKKNADTQAGKIEQGEKYTDANGKSFVYDKKLGWQIAPKDNNIGNANFKSNTLPLTGTSMFAGAIPVIVEGITAAIKAIIGVLIAKGIIDHAPDIPWSFEEHERGDWIVYQIDYAEIDIVTGMPVSSGVYKYGISGQAFYAEKPGHPRPERQVVTLNAAEALLVNEGVVKTQFIYTYQILTPGISQLSAEFIEQEMVNVYYSTHGIPPDGNLRPIPDALRGRTRAKFQKLDPKAVDKIREFIKNL